MRVRVTATTTTSQVDVQRPQVVVAAQARSVGVGSFERVTGLSCVIEGEVLPQHVPAIRQVADLAIARERLVRNHRPPIFAPPLARDDGFAVDQEKAPDSRQAQTRNTSESSLPNVPGRLHGNPCTLVPTAYTEWLWTHPRVPTTSGTRSKRRRRGIRPKRSESRDCARSLQPTRSPSKRGSENTRRGHRSPGTAHGARQRGTRNTPETCLDTAVPRPYRDPTQSGRPAGGSSRRKLWHVPRRARSR